MKLLIPNGSHHEIPLIRKAKALGYEVITSGAAPNGLGHPYADEYAYADFSDKDAILNIAQKKKIDRICSNCNDFGYLSACYVAERLGLPGYESYKSAEILHRKDRFRELAEKLCLSTPKARSFGDMIKASAYLRETAFPVIIKPVDLGAGQGVCRADSVSEGIEAAGSAFQMSKSGGIVIEPYIEGTNHSLNTFIVNGKVRAYYSDNEYMRYSRYRVSTSAGPADGIEKVIGRLLSDTEKVTEALGIRNGIMHIQYMMDQNEQPWIIEITRRMSGDWYPYPEMRATGIDWVKYVVKAQCGEDITDFPEKVTQISFTGRHCLNAPHRGIIRNVRFKPDLEQHIYDIALWIGDGFRVYDMAKDYPGIIFFDFQDRETQEEIVSHIEDYIEFEYV